MAFATMSTSTPLLPETNAFLGGHGSLLGWLGFVKPWLPYKVAEVARNEVGMHIQVLVVAVKNGPVEGFAIIFDSCWVVILVVMISDHP